MAKYMATIDEDTRQRIQALPGHISLLVFMRKALTVFVEELEENPDFRPKDFIITPTARQGAANKKRIIRHAAIR
ncbi:MAG TPA: hypothetical protein DCP92_12465 [Nitrospiraceae bacterium]|jgi:hypothetical protein|nr:hypothetical protein [Nitrospiraceae bacterium]